MVAITLNKLFMILFLPSFVVVGQNKGKGPQKDEGVTGSSEMPCSEAIQLGFLTDQAHEDIDDKGSFKDDTNLPFDGFPCGKFPFDGTGEPLTCTYFPAFNQYECECTTQDCKTVVADVKSNFAGIEQPCTAKDFVLASQVKNWWWQCDYVGPL